MKDQANKDLEKVINTIAEKIKSDVDSHDALRYTQAMLNAAHTINVLLNNKRR